MTEKQHAIILLSRFDRNPYHEVFIQYDSDDEIALNFLKNLGVKFQTTDLFIRGTKERILAYPVDIVSSLT